MSSPPLIKEEKNLKDDSANFTIAMSYWSCVILYTATITRFYSPYNYKTNWLAPGRQSKFHAPLQPSFCTKSYLVFLSALKQILES